MAEFERKPDELVQPGNENAPPEAAVGSDSSSSVQIPPRWDELIEEQIEAEEAATLVDLIKPLQQRCSAQRITAEMAQQETPEGTIVERLEIRILAGREPRTVRVSSIPVAKALMASEFDSCRFIQHYDAIWSENLRFIECRLTSGSSQSLYPVWPRIARLLETRNGNNSEQPRSPSERPGRLSPDRRWQLPSPDDGPTISIGRASTELTALLTGYTGLRNSLVSLRLDGVSISTHDAAKSLLERAGNSALFQIDTLTGVALSLAIEGRLRPARGKRIARGVQQSLSVPTQEYDTEPMALYWYARSAIGFPLLQFLAYYQVLEFYLPTYANAEAHRVLKNTMKDPAFNPNGDADVGKIIGIVRRYSGGRGYGEERQQLKIAMVYCVTADDIESFIKESEERKIFFQSKECEKLSRHKLITTRSGSELLGDVADRIYDIRCRIVHSKDDDSQQSALLPNSPELTMLGYDLDLIEFVSRRFLVAASRPIRWH